MVVEFIAAETGEVIDVGSREWLLATASRSMSFEDATVEYATTLAEENNTNIFIRWEAGAGSEGQADTLVRLERLS